MAELAEVIELPEQLRFEGVDLEGCLLVVRVPRRWPCRPMPHGERVRVTVEGPIHVVVRTDEKVRLHVLVADWVEVQA